VTAIQWRNLPEQAAPYDEEAHVLVRQSTIGQLQLCGKRVELAGSDGYLEPVSEPLVFGTCVHYLAEQDLLAGEPRLDLLTNMNEWIEEILVTEYDWTLAQVPNVRNFFDEIAGAYRLWRTTVRPTFRKEPLGVELKMELPLGEGRDKQIYLQGTCDVLFPSRLVDFKTSRSPWLQDKADVSIQASLYMALAKQTFDIEVKRMTFWNYARGKREWIPLHTARTVKQIDAALLSAYEYGLQMEAGIYPATPVPESSFNKKRGWYCSPQFCGAWNICPAKYLADDRDEKTVAIRSWK